MKKKIISLTIVASMFLGGQAIGIIPDTTEVVASAAQTMTGSVTATALNVRSKSNTSGKILGTLKNGTKVTIVEKCSNGWYKIKYKSGYGYVSGKYIKVTNNNNKKPSNQNSTTTAQNVVKEAKKHIGTPYKWGGTTTAGFDCSGFTQYVMNKCGIKIGRTARDQVQNGTAVSKANLKAGDLVFFKNTYKGCPTPSHVGIYIGENQVIHAGSDGVKISNLNSNYYTEHYYSARRVIK